MKKKLKKLKEEKNIHCLYNDSYDLKKFSVGYLIDYDDIYFLFESIDTHGNIDGLHCGLIETIIKIEINNSYSNKIEKLFKIKKQNHYDKIISNGDSLKAILDFAKKNKKICSIELLEIQENSIRGYINNLKNDILSIDSINDYGCEDGLVYVSIDKISYLSCDSLDDQTLELLYFSKDA